METTAYKFWCRVDVVLEAQGKTLVQFSEDIGQKYRNVILWRTRDVFPRTEYLPTIALALGTSVDWLLTGNDVPHLTPEQVYVKDDPNAEYIVKLVMKNRSAIVPLIEVLKNLIRE